MVGVDETWLKVRGKSRPVGMVLDVGGRLLGIELTGEGFDYVSWFENLADELGVGVVVTDDARAYDEGVEQSGLSRQQCMVHLRRGLSRAKSKLSEQILERYGRLLEELRLLAVRLLNRWRQMTLYQRSEGVPDSTNWVEGRFGRIKPRYRMTRGLKTDSGAVNFMSVACDVLR